MVMATSEPPIYISTQNNRVGETPPSISIKPCGTQIQFQTHFNKNAPEHNFLNNLQTENH